VSSFFSRPLGGLRNSINAAAFPAMNCWAIFTCPLRGLLQTLAIVRLKVSKL